MPSSSKLHIWHVGNWCIHIGQKYVESPFEAPSKDVEILNYAQPFIEALRAIPGAEVISQPSWELYHTSPEAFAERLQWATTIVFGDVETKCLMLHPDFFTRQKWGDQPITFPDRFDLLREWVEAGGHFHMNGGWLSFAGELGKGGWGRSRFHDVLPVECLQHDDRIESTAGFIVKTVMTAKILHHKGHKEKIFVFLVPFVVQFWLHPLGCRQCRVKKFLLTPIPRLFPFSPIPTLPSIFYVADRFPPA